MLVIALIGILLGTLSGAYVAWTFVGTNVIASHQQKSAIQELRREFIQRPQPRVYYPPKIPTTLGTDFAVIRIPKIHVVAPIVQGIRVEDLKRGAGHYPTSAAPGAKGNFALAGHRTTYGHPFYSINELRQGDRIYVETVTGTVVYRVTGHEIVEPSQWRVVTKAGLRPDQRVMTMTTCHPRHSASKRYVVRAELVAA